MPDDAPEDFEAVIYSLWVTQLVHCKFICLSHTKILLMALLQVIKNFKCHMSKVCEVDEWGFANIFAQWLFLDFRVAMKFFQSPVTKY